MKTIISPFRDPNTGETIKNKRFLVGFGPLEVVVEYQELQQPIISGATAKWVTLHAISGPPRDMWEMGQIVGAPWN